MNTLGSAVACAAGIVGLKAFSLVENWGYKTPKDLKEVECDLFKNRRSNQSWDKAMDKAYAELGISTAVWQNWGRIRKNHGYPSTNLPAKTALKNVKELLNKTAEDIQTELYYDYDELYYDYNIRELCVLKSIKNEQKC